jgi:hypothetical protein
VAVNLGILKKIVHELAVTAHIQKYMYSRNSSNDAKIMIQDSAPKMHLVPTENKENRLLNLGKLILKNIIVLKYRYRANSPPLAMQGLVLIVFTPNSNEQPPCLNVIYGVNYSSSSRQHGYF